MALLLAAHCAITWGGPVHATEITGVPAPVPASFASAPEAARGSHGLQPLGRTPKALDKPVAMRTSFIAETRFGLLAQDPWSPEAQTGALHAELLFARPFTPTDPLMRYFTPQPHIGASFNLGSRTSFVFAGLSWNIDLSPRVFIEATFGGALHDGHRGGVVRDDQAALGCAPLFRESASLGYRFSERLSFMATVEHYGNAGLCSENRGLTNIGARFGYTF
ncbi:MAG: acyloxyacyl hydrolase [Salinarimonas sp.]|nr:acyloxyacyl hydrolase [Salinarimonas sp.]